MSGGIPRNQPGTKRNLEGDNHNSLNLPEMIVRIIKDMIGPILQKVIEEITWACRAISNHTSLSSHLSRFGIVQPQLCQCQEDYDTLEHRMFNCRLTEGKEDIKNELTKDIGCTNGGGIINILAKAKQKTMEELVRHCSQNGIVI